MHRLVREWVAAEAHVAAARIKADELRALALDVPAPASLRPAVASDAVPGAVLWCGVGSGRKLPVLVSGVIPQAAGGQMFLAGDGSAHRLGDAWVEAARTGPFVERKHPPIPFGPIASPMDRRYNAQNYSRRDFSYGVLDEDPRYLVEDAIRISVPSGAGMADFDRWRIAKPGAKFMPVDALSDDCLRACMRWATGTGLAPSGDTPAGNQPNGRRRTREWLEGLTEQMIIAYAEARGFDGWCRYENEDDEDDGDDAFEFNLFSTKLPEWQVLPPGSRFGTVPDTVCRLAYGRVGLGGNGEPGARKVEVAAVTGEIDDDDLAQIQEVPAAESVARGVDPILAWNGHHHWTDAVKLGVPVRLRAIDREA